MWHFLDHWHCALGLLCRILEGLLHDLDSLLRMTMALQASCNALRSRGVSRLFTALLSCLPHHLSSLSPRAHHIELTPASADAWRKAACLTTDLSAPQRIEHLGPAFFCFFPRGVAAADAVPLRISRTSS